MLCEEQPEMNSSIRDNFDSLGKGTSYVKWKPIQIQIKTKPSYCLGSRYSLCLWATTHLVSFVHFSGINLQVA